MKEWTEMNPNNLSLTLTPECRVGMYGQIKNNNSLHDINIG